MPVNIIVTAGTEAEVKVAAELIAEYPAEAVVADKGYDSHEFAEKIKASGAEAVIPPRKNRKEQREYDKHVYKIRHLVENAFQRLKEWRGIATRYAKKASSFLAILQIRCTFMWIKIL